MSSLYIWREMHIAQFRNLLIHLMCVQLVAEKAVPLTEVVTEEHLKPFVKDHAQEIKEGVQQLTDQGIIPQAEEIRDNLPEAAEKFTEDTLKPTVERLSAEIEKQVCLPACQANGCISGVVDLHNVCGPQLTDQW